MTAPLLCAALLLFAVTAEAWSDSTTRNNWEISPSNSLLLLRQTTAALLHRATQGKLGLLEMVQITAVCGAIPGIWYLRRWFRKASDSASGTSTTKLDAGPGINEEASGESTFKYLRIKP